MDWNNFKKKNNISTYKTGDLNVIYSDEELNNIYNNSLHLIYDKIEPYEYDSFKRKYDLYCLFLSFNSDYSHNEENKYVPDYINWILINQNVSVKCILNKNISEDKKFNTALKKHKKYKILYYIGAVLWMTSCFWGPFTFGFIKEIITEIHNIDWFTCFMIGFTTLLFWSYTMPVTIPLSFFIGIFLHPKILKFLLFDNKCPYSDNLMKELNHSKSQEKQNAAAVFAGTVISDIIK